MNKSTLAKISLYFMALLYIVAGVNHFRSPQTYYKIMPSFLPYPFALIYISGFFESFLGLLLIFPSAKNIAAWGIVFLLIAVFPANVQMLLNYLHQHNSQLWIAAVRLPFQLVLIWWAFSFTDCWKRISNRKKILKVD